jgi:DNA-binding response OmpR family regulator
MLETGHQWTVRNLRNKRCSIIARIIMQIGVETSRAVDNKRLFIVHPDDVTRAVLQFILQDENEAHDLPTLQHAFEKAQDWVPDLLILDYDAAAADPSLLDRIATTLTTTRVLLVTEEGQDAAARQFVGSGAHGVLNKPFSVETVRRQVDATLGLLKAPMIQLQGLPA